MRTALVVGRGTDAECESGLSGSRRCARVLAAKSEDLSGNVRSSFPKAEWLPLWSAEFPDWFKEQNGKLYEIRMGSDYSSFHTLDDLGKLLCDADLKKIVRVLGSSKFLKNVLPKEVAESIFAHATGGNGEFKTEVEFRPNFKDAFFNMFGRGALEMSIEQCHNDSQVLTCDFSFVFEKKNNFTVLKNCYATYETQGGNRVSVELLKKTEKLSDFPWNAATEAKKKFPLVYAKLRDDLKNNRKKYEDFKICPTAKSSKDSFEVFLRKTLEKEWLRVAQLYSASNMSSVLDIFVTEDFLKGIFGETFWNILEHYSTGIFPEEGLLMDFYISECNGGLKVSLLFQNRCLGNMRKDGVYFFPNEGNEETADPFYFNYIKFCFFYDPKKDEISHVRLQDELTLNYELIQKGETSDTLLVVDDGDMSKPLSFSDELYWGDITKVRRCFTKDKKRFAKILSQCFRKTKKPANAHRKIRVGNK